MTTRLEQALGTKLPEHGRLIVYNGRASDLSFFPKDRTMVEQPFRPDYDALQTIGFDATPAAEGRFSAAVVSIPRAKMLARLLVARAAAAVGPGQPVWVDGQKTDGIDALLREIAGRVPLADVVAKAHGKCARFASPGPATFADWDLRSLVPCPGFVAPAGAFSAEGVDPGSALLADCLPTDLRGAVVDLGAGWGWLSAQVLARAPGVTELHLVEADHAALAAARQNVTDARARFHWADARNYRPQGRINAVVTNPPFHAGRQADPALGQAFIAAAAAMLDPGGRLFLVANRHLPYERVLSERFADLRDIGGDGRFKVLCASRLRRRTA